MADVTLKYASTGFEKVAKELADLEKMGGGSANWFAPMRQQLKDTEDAGVSFADKMKGALGKVGDVGLGLLETLGKIAGGIAVVAGIAAGAATAAFTSWAMSVLKTTESFRMLEISLYGATKSWEAVGTASAFAKQYAAEYPAMYGDVMKALQSFAYIPALKPMIKEGDVSAMKEMMHIVQGLMTMRPEQGVGGAIMALREALAGNWRSLMYRFDVPIASIAASAGMTMEQMKQSPEQAIKALKSFINEFVGAETMAMMAKNLGIQVGNLRDKYEMWLDVLGKTGVYAKVVDYLVKLNDWMDALMKSEKMQNWTKQINTALEAVVDGIVEVFTKGIDWENITDFASLMKALSKVADNAAEALGKLWDNIKEPIFAGLKAAFKFAADAIKPVVKEVFFPIGRDIASFIVEGLLDFMKEHPIIAGLLLGVKGAMMGAQVGGAWGAVIAGGAGLLGGIAPAVIDSVKKLFGGGEAKDAAKSIEGLAEAANGVTDEQREEISSIREVN